MFAKLPCEVATPGRDARGPQPGRSIMEITVPAASISTTGAASADRASSPGTGVAEKREDPTADTLAPPLWLRFRNNYAYAMTVRIGPGRGGRVLVRDHVLMRSAHHEDDAQKWHFVPLGNPRDGSGGPCLLVVELQQPSPLWKDFSLRHLDVFEEFSIGAAGGEETYTLGDAQIEGLYDAGPVDRADMLSGVVSAPGPALQNMSATRIRYRAHASKLLSTPREQWERNPGTMLDFTSGPATTVFIKRR